MVAPLVNHDLTLTIEVERILADFLFVRSPTQSRLLRYLADCALQGGAPPSQYQVAVDGLGRDANYDIKSDSYPRVQASRLRSNLDNYYARNCPATGFRVILQPGCYRLTLRRLSPEEESRTGSDEARMNALTDLRDDLARNEARRLASAPQALFTREDEPAGDAEASHFSDSDLRLLVAGMLIAAVAAIMGAIVYFALDYIAAS